MGCLCGCGSNDLRCLLPNRPPSPNTFYENWWAPEFTYMLRTRLDKVAMRLEPSKRIWWREEFGGCAPDREPLDSEIWNTKYQDRGNVLRTSPPPFEDQTQEFQQDHSSKGLLDIRNSSPDEAPTARRKPRPPKSPTHYIPDKFPALHFPDPITRKALQGKPREYTAEEDEQLLQSALRMQEANDLERQRLYGIPLEQSKVFPTKGLPPISQKNQYVRAPNSILNQNKASKPEEHQQIKQSPTDDYLSRLQQERNGSPPLLARDITYPDDQRKSVSRGPSVRPKVKSPKSPTHYIPDTLPPLDIPDFSKEPPARRALRLKKKPTVEDEEQFQQTDDPWLEVMRLVEVMKAERLRRQEYRQLKESMYQKIGAMKLRRSQRRGITIHQSDNASSASPHTVPHVDPVEEELSVFPASEELRQLKPSLLEKIEAMRLRMSRRQGITIHHSENASSASLHSVPHVDPVEEALSVAEMFPAPEELRLLKTSLLERIEAMRLRRSRRHGTAIHRSEASVPMDSNSSSRHVEVGEVSPKIEFQRRSSEASPQKLEPSLSTKVEAIKQSWIRKQGTAIHPAEEARDQYLASPSLLDQATGALLGTQVHNQNLILDRPPTCRVHSCQDFKAMTLGTNRCQGVARSF